MEKTSESTTTKTAITAGINPNHINENVHTKLYPTNGGARDCISTIDGCILVLWIATTRSIGNLYSGVELSVFATSSGVHLCS